MARPFCLTLAVLFLVSASGCGWMAPPRLAGPGPAAYQRQQALNHDPYPQKRHRPARRRGTPAGVPESDL